MNTVELSLVHRFQAALPSGLEIVGDELIGSSSCGHVYRAMDSRIDPGQPVPRIVRFLEVPDRSAPWLQALRKRAGKLGGLSFPYVSPLREFAEGGDIVYIVHDAYLQNLAGKSRAREGLSAGAVMQIAEQLLVGLASLHSQGIAHGDLRAANVFLSEAPTAERFAGCAWIVDTIVGDFSGGVPPNCSACCSPSHLPPEWDGKPGAKSPHADLYSLGVLLCEALLSPQSVEEGHQSAQEENSSLWTTLRSRLKQRGARGALEQLLKMLLADQDERPANAGDALKQVRQRRERRVGMTKRGLVAVLVLAIVAGGGMWLRHTKCKGPPGRQRQTEGYHRRKGKGDRSTKQGDRKTAPSTDAAR